MVIYKPKKCNLTASEKDTLSDMATLMFSFMKNNNILDILIIDSDERNEDIEKKHHQYVDFYTDELLKMKRERSK